MEPQRVMGAQQTPQSQFTQDKPKGIVRYANRVQGLAYGGAAALVVIIGLRAIYGRQVPEAIVLAALGLEATLLIMIAMVYYFTPEDKGGSAPSTDSQILSGEKEILQLLKRDIISGENEMIKVLKHDIAGSQREMVSVLRNELLTSQREMADALRSELMNGNSVALRVLQGIETHMSKLTEGEAERTAHSNMIANGQRELVNVMRNEVLVHEREVFGAIRNEIANGEAQSLHVLQKIEGHIGKVVENEIERVVQSKVQEVFTQMVRQEVHRSLEARGNKS